MDIEELQDLLKIYQACDRPPSRLEMVVREESDAEDPWGDSAWYIEADPKDGGAKLVVFEELAGAQLRIKEIVRKRLEQLGVEV